MDHDTVEIASLETGRLLLERCIELVSKAILPAYGSFRGKGENLWKSLYVLEGDIIVWVDADISNIAPKFVYGLIGPLLEDDGVSYVKAFYERPIRSEGKIAPSGGGRVTEILVRPCAVSLCAPVTSSGRYAAVYQVKVSSVTITGTVTG